MIPVYQTKIHTESTNGNCLRASLASILETSIENIPRFEDMDKNSWKDALKLWLNGIGLKLNEQYEPPNHNQYYIAIGKSNRGILHCVVAQLGETIHDPHPSQDGLINIKNIGPLATLLFNF